MFVRVMIDRLKTRRIRKNFNRLTRPKTGLHSHVHILDNAGLTGIMHRHPFNQNLIKTTNRDKKFPKFLQFIPSGATYFIICDAEDRIIASATLRIEQTRLTEMKISQISVHKDFRNQGYATRLLQSIKDHMNIAHPDVTRLTISKFKPLGWKYLRPKFIALAPQFKAETFETDDNKKD